MSAAAPTRKWEWLVVVPDFPDVMQKRLDVRPQHLANMTPFVESGAWKMGGAILNEVPPDDKPTSLNFAGSMLIMVAETKEEIVTTLKNDIYGTSGVWDVDNAQIWPIKSAFRHP